MSKEKLTSRLSEIITVYRGQNTYVEIANVGYDRNGKMIIGAARPITRDAMSKIMSLTASDQQESYFSSKLIPENVLMFQPEKYRRKIIWWRKASQVNIILNDKLKMRNGLMPMPAMLFDVSISSLRIFALKDSRRPKLNTILYNAPLLNYYSNNTLCWGSVKTDTSNIKTIDDEIKYWEDKLWNSEFSHAGGEATTRTDIIELYKKLINSGKKFPIGQLIKTNLKLSDLL
jgi:PRTRC genetic system protein B